MTLLPLTLATLLSPGAAPPAAALTLRNLEPEAARLVRPLLKGKKGVGIVVGAITRKGQRIFGFGGVACKGGKPPDGDTVYEIGSVTKTFTGILLADLARRGLLKLDDPAQKHLPPGLKMPRRGKKEVTLLQLATHTSGLPVQPGFLGHLLRTRDFRNPYSHYGVKELRAFLARCKPGREPGFRYGYSNLGAGLLGMALVHRAGAKSYDDLVQKRIAGPLRLKDTCVKLSAEQRKRLTGGHDEKGEPTSGWDFACLEGCGGLRSSARDLLRYLSANLGLVRTPLAGALADSQKPRADTTQPNLRVGLGWHVLRLPGRRTVVLHSGGTGGYRCCVAFIRDRGTGVVVLTNSAQLGGRVDQVALGLLLRLRGTS
jgi:CubicO group peptidase (beta-lactamase class C family)